MIGMTSTTTQAAQVLIRPGPRVVSLAFCVAGAGTTPPGTYACRSAAGPAQPRGAPSTGFVVAGKWLALDPFPLAYGGHRGG